MIYNVFEQKNWTCIENDILRDVTVSAKAKGVFCYLLSLPRDWELHVNELVTHFSDGIDGIRSGLQELKEHKYLRWEQVRDETGKIIGCDYFCNQVPQRIEPHLENPDLVNPTLLNTNPILSTNKTIVATESQQRIIEHLNARLGKKPPKGFKVTNQKCLKDLNARLREYSEADIIAVIDLKCDDWIDTDWQKFLRPMTLFNVNKFESYVNEIDIEGSQNEIGSLKELE